MFRFKEDPARNKISRDSVELLRLIQGGPGTEPELETGTIGTVFPGTEPPEPFLRNRNQNRPSLFNCTEKQEKKRHPSQEEPLEAKTRTANPSTPKP